MSGNTINDGGPMFSRPNPNYDGNWDKRPTLEGSSLRDWFAGQALITLVQTYADSDTKHAHNTAMACYAFADAMIAARQPKQPTP